MEVFRNLRRDDLKEIALFLGSGFNNRSHLKHDVIRLFSILSDAYPEFSPDILDKNTVYEFLFPGSPAIKGKLEKITSELNKLIREYLLWKYYQGKDAGFIRSIHWSRILREFSLDERYEQYLARIEKEQFSELTLSPQYFYHRFLLEYERHFWMSTVNQAKKDINLSVAIDSLSVFFEVYRLELLNRLLIQQKVAHLEITPSIQINLNTIFNLIPNDANVILLISSRIHHLLKKEQPSLEEFTDLMSLLKEREQEIESALLMEYYMYLRNFCTFLINSDHDHLIPILHQLHRDNLDRGYLYLEGKLLATSYISIAKMAIMASNIEWAIDFVESHKDKVIGETEGHDFYHINKAQCLFARKEFDAALDLLPPTSENAMYYLLARRIEVMCYYEQHSESIINKIEAFKMLIRRASEKFLSSYLRDQNNAFANFLYQIVLTTPGDKKRAALIAERIKAKKPVAESKWLLSKVQKWI